MGQAKAKRALGFTDADVRRWEADDCVNFAIALARRTEWLLHVDWLTPNGRKEREAGDEAEMVPLRVYVGDDSSTVFDARGITSIWEFSPKTVARLAKERSQPTWRQPGVTTRTYAEDRLWSLPLRRAPDIAEIDHATKVIDAHPTFPQRIPPRATPTFPAKFAANYQWGFCAMFAEAFEDLTGEAATAFCIDEMDDGWASGEVGAGGYVHSFVPHADGTATDSWGRQSTARIAERFGALRWHEDRELHLRVVARLRGNSPERYAERYEAAREMLVAHGFGAASKP
ncbi:hypothetical protein [Aureimonas jatrophae]|uniref:Uncharacterized protein n=1 Tax=Aureimonas jatrophae TaxID=1166073 RepID=A0A1H0JCY3_9HYPH|nr:hypothetical protein [Aureimonas jatrophae]MBB3951478.1 hypothetical protein [Aureimonas jatrophae]SDO41400.1 hypothetical protein SAMN05192530_106118 [Aureimonas jatrophae]